VASRLGRAWVFGAMDKLLMHPGETSLCIQVSLIGIVCAE
jgi:hypothetical protein